MFCTKCGAKADEGIRFCTQCGAEIPAAGAPAGTPGRADGQPPMDGQPVYPQPVFPGPAAYQAVPPPKKKKRHTGLYVLLGILIVLVGAVVYLLGSLSLFKPKNLGIRYDQADFNSVVQKLGLHVTADLGNGETYDNAPILSGDAAAVPDSTISSGTLKGKLSYKDYDWSFSDYQPVSVTLTPEEVSAFFNEIAPTFWWFDDTQVKIAPDGTIITSTRADIRKILEDLFPDVAGYIPVPLPDSANLYTEGDFAITDNRIAMDPDVIKVGPVSIPGTYLEGENLDVFSEYLGRFYTIIPDLQINSAGVQGGEFVFDGVIPTEVSVTPKAP